MNKTFKPSTAETKLNARWWRNKDHDFYCYWCNKKLLKKTESFAFYGELNADDPRLHGVGYIWYNKDWDLYCNKHYQERRLKRLEYRRSLAAERKQTQANMKKLLDTKNDE